MVNADGGGGCHIEGFDGLLERDAKANVGRPPELVRQALALIAERQNGFCRSSGDGRYGGCTLRVRIGCKPGEVEGGE